MEEVRILLIEKEKRTVALLQELSDDYGNVSVAGIYTSFEDLDTAHLADHIHAVLCSVDTCDKLQLQSLRSTAATEHSRIILLSKHPADAVAAFELGAFDFIPKPIAEARVRLMFLRLFADIRKSAEREVGEKVNALYRYMTANRTKMAESEQVPVELIPVKQGGKIYFLRSADVEYIIASGYYIEIHAKGRKHLVREPLRDIVKRLDHSEFVRIHRSVVVSLNFLSEIIRNGSSDFNVKMHDGAVFKISKSYKGSVFDKVGIRS